MLQKFTGLVLAAVLLAGCGGSENVPPIEITYNRAAATETPFRNPVIVIPGVLGSKLKDQRTGQPVWGAFIAGAADPQTDEGLRQITAPYFYPDGSATNWSFVVPDGALDQVKVEVLGIPLSVAAYAQIINALGAGGFRGELTTKIDEQVTQNENFTAYQFAYDWRLSNADNAARLFDFVQEVRQRTIRHYEDVFGLENPDVKVDIVAHSMGGLLTRYMLRYGNQDLPDDGGMPLLDWSGTLGVERVILIGTPNAGSVNSLIEMTEGKNYGWPVLPFYPPATLGSFSSLYQLLPRDRHHAVRIKGVPDDKQPSIFDIDTWERYGWGLMNPDQDKYFKRLFPDVSDPAERRRIARATLVKHLDEARRFHEALDIPAAPPAEIIFNLVLGGALETNRTIEWDPNRRRFEVVDTAPGDSIVPRYSALMDERADGNEDIWTPRLRSPIDYDGVVFLPYEHVELTQSKVFIDNLLYWLLVEPRPSGTPLGYPLKKRANGSSSATRADRVMEY